jgi:hypothetical protein
MLEIKIRSSGLTLTLDLNSSNGNEQGSLVITPSDLLETEELRAKLNQSKGAFGHSLDTQALTPIDLVYALGMLGYAFDVTIGSEMVESYDPGIPEDAVT